MVKEEDRLATTIEAIDYDVRIVPRGAYFRTALGTVEGNRSFEGEQMRRAVNPVVFSVEWYISSQWLTEQGFCLSGAEECMKKKV